MVENTIIPVRYLLIYLSHIELIFLQSVVEERIDFVVYADADVVVGAPLRDFTSLWYIDYLIYLSTNYNHYF